MTVLPGETFIIQQEGKKDDIDNDVVGVDDDGDVVSPPSKCPMRSMGRGKMTVEFFSAEIELSV